MASTVLTKSITVPMVLVPGRTAEGEIRKLEQYALDRPETRDRIIGTLDEYARRSKGTRSGTHAKAAVARIRAVIMLEALSEKGQD